MILYYFAKFLVIFIGLRSPVKKFEIREAVYIGLRSVRAVHLDTFKMVLPNTIKSR